MATENLKVKITADAAQAKAEIGKFKNSLKETVSASNEASSSMLKLKGALAALVAVKAAKEIAKTAIEVAAAGDAIKDNAQKVFMNTTAFQEWGYVLKQNGVEMSTLKTAMRQFAPQVAAGSEALRKYGITATDVDTAFQQAVYAIQNLGTETERITAATELFGSRALELFPVLNLTNAETQSLMASYRALGGTMSNELIAASDTCSDSITAMKAAWSGLRNVLAQYFLPIITKVIQWITIAIAYVRILLSAIFGLKETFGGGGSKKNSLPATTGAVAANTGNTAGNLQKAVKHAKELKRTMMGIDELSRLVEQATAAASSPSGGGGGSSVPSVGVGDPGSFDGIISDETLNKIKNFQEKIESIKEYLNGAYLILKGLVEISFGNFKQGIADITDGLGKLIPDSVKEKWESFKTSIKEKISTAISVVLPVWTTVKSTWEAFVANFKDIVKTVAAKLPTWNDVKSTWEAFVANFKDIAKKVTAKIPSWDDVKKTWSDFEEKFKDIVRNVSFKLPKWKGSKLQTNWSKLRGKFKGKKVNISVHIPTWKDLKKKWETLTSNFGNISRTISLSISTKLSQLRGWINSYVIGPLNNTIRKVLPDFGGIPYLSAAKGAGLTAPTAVLAGEYPGAKNNPEVISPQSLMLETIQKANGDLVGAFASLTRDVIAAIEGKDLAVSIGDEAIARSAQRGNAAYRARTGKALLGI